MFLNKHGWNIQTPVGQDSSIRRYFRVEKENKTAILMETVPDGSAHATPGHSISDFIRIAGWLNSVGLNAPDIYEQDLENGYLLLEDFGECCFRDAAQGDANMGELYELAAEVLNQISSQDCPLDLPSYYDSHVHKRHRRVVDWFVPLVRQKKNEDGLVENYQAVWQEIEKSLSPVQEGFLHIDFHAQNLMWLPEGQGLKRCGILDFQGAMRGPLPYDLGNLLEDARTDVPQDIKDKILEGLSEEQRAWFRVLTTQFHCRVIGQFIKQAAVDDNASYLPYIPRLQKHLHEGLQDPVLKPLALWFQRQGVDFTSSAELAQLSELRALAHPDAL